MLEQGRWNAVLAVAGDSSAAEGQKKNRDVTMRPRQCGKNGVSEKKTEGGEGKRCLIILKGKLQWGLNTDYLQTLDSRHPGAFKKGTSDNRL